MAHSIAELERLIRHHNELYWQKAAPEILFRYYENGSEGCLVVANTSRNKTAALELPAFNGTVCDFFDPAWTYRPGEKITLEPYGTLTVRMEKKQ